MRITVVGVILIVVIVAAGAFLVLALNENKNSFDDKQDGGSQQDQFWQPGIGA